MLGIYLSGDFFFSFSSLVSGPDFFLDTLILMKLQFSILTPEPDS